ncbi:Multifunctional non-homologous end joining protein LigD [uncultured bacterium]|nr:Multifunctional non-homologous end joining protein LigD [uncultured bacterium]
MKQDRFEEYRSKRDFSSTPEPTGGAKGQGAGLFVVQKHSARALHYDLRLEWDGALKSWAVPKGPSIDPEEKRLAVQVEDHPLEYAGFEGIIPKGEYGGGSVIVWDRGFWVPESDPADGLRKGHLKFSLCGRKLRGGWSLVKLKEKEKANGKEEWLLVKERDEEAARGDILAERPESVVSGRSVEEVAKLPEGRWSPMGKTAQVFPYSRWAEKKELPERLSPQLASLVDNPPEGEGWLHELKYDGYRLLARIEKGQVRLFTRNGNDWTGKFPSIAGSVSKLPINDGWLDGEAAALKENGTTDFEALQSALSKGSDKGLVYMIFDILHYNGYDLTGLALSERKLLAAALLKSQYADLSILRMSQHVEGKGAAFFENACVYGVEGIISKRKNSAYARGRGRDWVKIKCHERQEFVIGGYTEPASGRQGFGALLIGVFGPEGTFLYCGRVGTGFNERSIMDISERLKKNEVPSPPFHNPPTGQEAKGVHWVRPELVAEVEFAQWTKDGVLRQPSFQGLREDKSPREVTRERPAELKAAAPADEAPAAARPLVMRVTNPGRVFYPEDGYTKKDLIDYYKAAAPLMLPHLAGRPLTLVRCPEGYDKECFFQKHVDGAVPSGIKRVKLIENDGTPAEYLLVDSPEGLAGLAQLGTLEIHTWGSRSVELEYPDRIIFDIDPDAAVAWEQVVEAAFLLKGLLDELGLRSFVKATGGKGVHVVAPVMPVRTWEEVRAFTKLTAEFLARGLPGRFTSMMTKTKRAGKIFLDYMRNIRGATAIEAWSTRARKSAPIAVPLRWEELAIVRPDSFTLANVRERLKAGNPWEGYMDLRQPVTDEMMLRLGGDGEEQSKDDTSR